MSFGPELIARLGLDASAFTRGIARVQQETGGLDKALKRKIGGDDAFKSLVAGLGISIENIAERIAEAWVGGTRRGLEEIKQLYDQEGTLIERNIFERLPDEKAQAAYINREIDKVTKELNRPREMEDKKTVVVTGIGGVSLAPGFKEPQEDYEMRMAKARVRLAELQAVQIGQEKKTKEENKKLDEDVAKIGEARTMRELDASMKVARLTDQQWAAERAVDAAAEGTVEKKKAIIALEEISLKLLAAEREQLQDYNEALEARDRKKREDESREKRIGGLKSALGQAQDQVASAQQVLKTGKQDALSLTIQDAAAGKGTQTMKAKAKEILRIEDQARRVNLSGATEMRDYQGRPMTPQQYAARLQSRAEDLRAKAGFLQSSDQRPFAAAEKALEEANKHLDSIRAALTAEINAR